MGQLGFFDLRRRYESPDEKNDPLVAIAAIVPFIPSGQSCRLRRSNAGRHAKTDIFRSAQFLLPHRQSCALLLMNLQQK